MTNELHKQFDDKQTIVKVLIDDVTDYVTLITYLDWQGYNWSDEEFDSGEDIDLHLDYYEIAKGFVESGKYKNMAVFIDIFTHTFIIGKYDASKVDVVEQFYGEEQEGTIYSFKTFDEFLEKYILIGSDNDLDELAERTAERLVNEVAYSYVLDEDGFDFEPDSAEASEQIQYQSVPASHILYSQTLDALKDKEGKELIVFTNNGQTYLFSNVTNFTTTTTGFKFTYEGKMTGETREATFNNTSVAGFALK